MTRCMRLWRLLTAEKRSGQALGIDEEIKFRPPGSLVMPCLRCPIRFVNMPKKCKDLNELKKCVCNY